MNEWFLYGDDINNRKCFLKDLCQDCVLYLILHPLQPQVPLSDALPLTFPLPSEESSVEFGSVEVRIGEEQHPFPCWCGLVLLSLSSELSDCKNINSLNIHVPFVP